MINRMWVPRCCCIQEPAVILPGGDSFHVDQTAPGQPSIPFRDPVGFSPPAPHDLLVGARTTAGPSTLVFSVWMFRFLEGATFQTATVTFAVDTRPIAFLGIPSPTVSINHIVGMSTPDRPNTAVGDAPEDFYNQVGAAFTFTHPPNTYTEYEWDCSGELATALAGNVGVREIGFWFRKNPPATIASGDEYSRLYDIALNLT